MVRTYKPRPKKTVQERLAAYIEYHEGHWIWKGPMTRNTTAYSKPRPHRHKKWSKAKDEFVFYTTLSRAKLFPRPYITVSGKQLSVIRLLLNIADDPKSRAYRLAFCRLATCVNPAHHQVRSTSTPNVPAMDEIQDLINMLENYYPHHYPTLRDMQDNVMPNYTIDEYIQALSQGDFPEWSYLIS